MDFTAGQFPISQERKSATTKKDVLNGFNQSMLVASFAKGKLVIEPSLVGW
jgi:hypothetical protein